MNKRYALIGWMLWITVAAMAQSAPVSNNDHIPGQILLRLKPTVTTADFDRSFSARYRSAVALVHERALGSRFNIHLYTFNPASEAGQILLDQVRQHPMVVAAQFNYVIEPRTEPNDPAFSLQWTVERIDLPKVWDITTGGVTARGDTIVLAILDSGFDINHEDLRDNVWINRSEIPGNGLDDDGNDYIDDVTAWNFINNSSTHIPDAHGTS